MTELIIGGVTASTLAESIRHLCMRMTKKDETNDAVIQARLCIEAF